MSENVYMFKLKRTDKVLTKAAMTASPSPELNSACMLMPSLADDDSSNIKLQDISALLPLSWP
jgi:hypothetical protein